jgi:hypothetical protein
LSFIFNAVSLAIRGHAKFIVPPRAGANQFWMLKKPRLKADFQLRVFYVRLRT